jgi:hypothetical protein
MEALALVPEAPDPKALAGFGSAEDAAVYRLRDDLAVAAWRPRSRRCSGPTASPPLTA